MPNTHGFWDVVPSCQMTKFSVTDGDWIDKIRLPDSFNLLDVINNATSSGKTLEIHDSITYVAGTPLKLAAGRALHFSSRHASGEAYPWSKTFQSVPNSTQWQIPRNSDVIAHYKLSDGRHAPELILPPDGQAFDTITIENNATFTTTVLGTHTAFPDQRITVASGESVRAEFDPVARQWMWVHAPFKKKPVYNRNARVSHRTVMELQDGEWASLVGPPSSAFDRDRLILRSNATWDSEVQVNKGDHVSQYLPLRRGDEYEFIFLAETGRWHVLRQPSHSIETTDRKEVRLKDEGYGVIEVTAPRGGTTTPNVILPKPRQGLRVIAVGHPVTTMNIIADNLNVPVLNDEKIAFAVNGAGHWERETRTIDLLWALDMSSTEIPKRWDALTLMRENIRLANEALENSGATFRYRLVGNPIEQFTYPGLDLRRVPAILARDRKLHALLKQHAADGIYYGGSNLWARPEVCDDHFNSYNEKVLVIATALTCPTTSFRRTAGFVVGVPNNSVAKPVQVIGSGDQFPFYPSPHRLLPDGRWAVNPGQEHVLDRMNSWAGGIAGYSDRW
ncbi:MAG TPA: hypothetical protein DD677_03740 [Stenotrophomonas sp.]|nr:hypothetical protein [Stenotrophomonas sp.]